MQKRRSFRQQSDGEEIIDDASQTGRTVLKLREMILRGDFRGGERVSELPLSARLGVSRTPIRLALERLAHEGLVQVWPSGGFVVREFTVEDVWDAIELRGTLEGTAARLAAERVENGRQLVPLRKCFDEMDSIRDLTMDSFPRYLDLNEAFHTELVRLSRNEMLSRTLELVVSLPFAAPSAVVFARTKLPAALKLHAIGQEQHRAIVEAVENRQGSRAESLAREHAQLSRRTLEIVLSDADILSSVPGGLLIKA